MADTVKEKDGKIWTHHEPWYRFVDPMEYLKDYGIIKHMHVVSEEEMKEREAKAEEKRLARSPRKRGRSLREKSSKKDIQRTFRGWANRGDA